MISIKKLQGLSSRRTPGSRVIHYWIPIFIGMTLFLSSFFIVHADNIDHEAREIADQLRCPVCRGVPIAESPSELAHDMMSMIRKQLQDGKSREEILVYFTQRYGDWILLQPKAEGMNLSLWVLPIVLLGGGIIFIFVLVNRWSKRRDA